MPFGGAIVTLALQGEDAEPDTVAPTTTYGVFTTSPDVANDGTVVFKARTAGEEFKEVLYLCAESICPTTPAEAAVIQGDVGPNSTEYRFFGIPVVADGGLMAFKAKGRGPLAASRPSTGDSPAERSTPW